MPYTNPAGSAGRGSPYASGAHSETSHAAAEHADKTREHRGRAYVKLLYGRGPLTDHEAAAALDCPLSAINSTRNATMVYELVECTGDKRRTQYDQMAFTWRLTTAGRASAVAMLPSHQDAGADEPTERHGHDLNTPTNGRLL